MLRLISDEQIHGDIIRGLLRRAPGLDLVRAQDVGLQRTPDPIILRWAANENRVLISEDRVTVPEPGSAVDDAYGDYSPSVSSS